MSGPKAPGVGCEACMPHDMFNTVHIMGINLYSGSPGRPVCYYMYLWPCMLKKIFGHKIIQYKSLSWSRTGSCQTSHTMPRSLEATVAYQDAVASAADLQAKETELVQDADYAAAERCKSIRLQLDGGIQVGRCKSLVIWLKNETGRQHAQFWL